MDNVSVIGIFILSGLNETVNYRITIFSLTLLYYCMILFFNISIIMIVILDQNLHEPMYILLCSFCFNGLYGTTGFYPKLLLDLLSSSQQISYEGCLLQAFVMYSFACCELSILAVMAYDRYLAICRPLHYNSVMTKRRLSQLICFSWLTPFCIFSINIVLTSRLNLCGSKIPKLFCVNWVIVKLTCPGTDTVSSNIFSYAIIIIYVCHGLFTIWTYMHMIRTCVRSKVDRVKFIQTCVPHLVSLVTFLVVIVFDLMYLRFGSTDLPQSIQNFIAIEFLLIPPVMNPLIYGFKLTKIRNRILGLINFERK
ncbi:olfactory receptor 6F1-like [Cyclopterus lumpus]|uniref:G-protein coupled receptors family 1 profile domain-containing protein n=1 Tax=Cyclopterus lumpus TaxID=8103 RepID=A0A8C2ZIA0_CYCLU|nr:olfactory receptor 6F1-like [Cyclopterus lumpus]